MKIFVTDWGEFAAPEDIPIRMIRRDGWFDRRYKESNSLHAYFNEMTNRLRDSQPILTWTQWKQKSNAQDVHA